MSDKALENLSISDEISAVEINHAPAEPVVAVIDNTLLVATLPGHVLAAKREELRWSLEEAAERLKLTPRQVVALEANDFDALPGMSSVRGFVRSYAKLLGLDPELMLEMLSGEPNPAQGQMLLRRPLPMNGFPGQRSSPPPRNRAGLTKFLASVIIVTAMGAVGYEAYRSEWIPVAMLEDWVPELTWPSIFSVTLIEENQLEKISSAVTEKFTATPVPVVSPSQALEIIVTQDAWVEITTFNGTKIVSRLMKAGTTELFEITEPVVLVVGNATGVKAKLRGQLLNLKAVARDNVSKLSLK
ncbi:MAG: DUF4115 domain-containing protein [Oxalobacteraceae bacterium]|jgi:cytoskeleton protein RodZ|nr:DUF4115 domain-containing protein [Oxalobacteraceae bacterium]